MGEQITNARSVFVVHGRNEPLRKAMFDFLRSINLSPMEWSHAVELTGEGSPTSDKFSTQRSIMQPPSSCS